MVARNHKGSVRYRQFAGGYAQTLDSQLSAVLAGYQRGLLRRNEVPVFAGQLELALRERVVVGDVRPAVRLGDPQRGQSWATVCERIDGPRSLWIVSWSRHPP